MYHQKRNNKYVKRPVIKEEKKIDPASYPVERFKAASVRDQLNNEVKELLEEREQIEDEKIAKLKKKELKP